MTAALALGVALCCTALGQVAYKAYFGRRTRALLMMALASLLVAQAGFYLALRHFDVGPVYMSMGATQVMVLALSRYVLRERITSDHYIAVGLIVAGLGLYAL